MEFYGYGYRKNCFGERMFFEDNMDCYGTNTVKKALSTAFATMKKDTMDTHFSFIVITDTDECYAITEYDKETDTYTVVYSKSFYSIDAPQKMSKKAITATIMKVLENEQNEHGL